MIKSVNTPGYNYQFDTRTGVFKRWGSTQEENPSFSPLGPELADIEISTICHNNCGFCYKSNSTQGENMPFETFQAIFEKIRGNLTQVALGIGDLWANPDLVKILKYCRQYDVIPNITINGRNLHWDSAHMLASLCGGIAVSLYNDINLCFYAVDALFHVGARQITIHKLLNRDTYADCLQLLNKISDSRPRSPLLDDVEPTTYREPDLLRGLSAVVFLAIKPKGRAADVDPKPVSVDDMIKLIYRAYCHQVTIGFDSCLAPIVMKALSICKFPKNILDTVEPCEGGLFSMYVNVNGKMGVCSFAEGVAGPEFDLLSCTDFINDVWLHKDMATWRTNLLSTVNKCDCSCRSLCRRCPIYCITPCVHGG